MIAQVGFNSSTTLTADDRTNQVIIVADARLYAMFDDLIDKLDTKGDSNTRTEVIKLKAADCTDLTLLLNNLINGEATAAQKAGQQSQRGAQVGAMPTPAAPTHRPRPRPSKPWRRKTGCVASPARMEATSPPNSALSSRSSPTSASMPSWSMARLTISA